MRKTTTPATRTPSTPCKVDVARKCAGEAEAERPLEEDMEDAVDAAQVEAQVDSHSHLNNSNGFETTNAFSVVRKATSSGIAHKLRGGRVASTSS